MRIIRSPLASNFTKVPNTALRDSRLSWKARGLHAFLLSHVDEGWPSAATYLAEQGPDGRDSCEAGLRELAKHGYIERTRRQVEGGRWTTDITVFEVPQPNTENPGPANPQETAGRTDNGKPVSGETEPGKSGSGPTCEDTQSPSSDRTRVDRDPENPGSKEKTTEETKKISQSAQAREAIRWLHERYGLTDQESAVVIEEARRRAAEPIRSLVKYLTGMAEDEHGNPKPDLAVIVEAVQLHGRQVGDQPFEGRPCEEKPQVGRLTGAGKPSPQRRPPLTAVAPIVTGPAPKRGPGKAALAELDATHAKICVTVGCERCARVRAEQELASA